MKHKRLFIHLLSIIILAAGLGLSILIQPEPGGYVRLAKGLAMVALVFILASLLFNGKLVPLITSSGYFLSFLVTHVINFVLSIRRLIKISRVKIPIRIPAFTLLAAAVSVWGAGFVAAPTARAVSYIVILGCLLVLLKVISKEDIAWVKGLIYKK